MEAVARVSAADVAASGAWHVGALPATNALRLRIFGCTADNRVSWAGQTDGVRIRAGEETTARVFLLPPGKVACTGSAGAGGSWQSRRALAAGAVLPSGTALAAGGASWWDGTLAKGSVATDAYDPALGQWRPGPNLVAPRLGAHVVPLDGQRALVLGGAARVRVANNTLPLALFAPDDVADAARPQPFAEVLDLTPGAGGSVPSPLDLGAAARPLAAALPVADGFVFVGGLVSDGSASRTAARVHDLQALASGQGVPVVALQLAAARVQPALAAFADGSVVVWGGQASGAVADQAELLLPGAADGVPLDVTGDVANAAAGTAAVIGATAVVLGEAGDTLTLLLAGGVPMGTGWATHTQAYVVTIDRAARTAVTRLLQDAQGVAMPGGYGMAATRLADGSVLLAGGLLALGKVPLAADPQGLCQSDEATVHGCLAPDLALLALPAQLDAGPVQVTRLQVERPAPQPGHFGQLVLPLPVGALVAGGFASAVALPDHPTEALDASAALVSAPYPTAANAAACGP